MATCCFCSLQDLPPPLGRWWTLPPHTRLHHYHPFHLPHPLLRPPWSHGPCQHPRSRRMRLISIWPSKMGRSTGTEIHSCKKQTYSKHPDWVQTSDAWWFLSFYRCRHGSLGKCVHCVPLEVRDFTHSLFLISETWSAVMLAPLLHHKFVQIWLSETLASLIFVSLLTKTTWITSTHQWSTCHSTHTFASWPAELTSEKLLLMSLVEIRKF